MLLTLVYAHVTVQSVRVQHSRKPIGRTVLLQGDLLSRFRREQLQAPPLWQLQHYHRCACVPAELAQVMSTPITCSPRWQTFSDCQPRPCRLFDPPVDQRSSERRQSSALPIPSSYVYSPSLVPRPQDWPDHVQVQCYRLNLCACHAVQGAVMHTPTVTEAMRHRFSHPA